MTNPLPPEIGGGTPQIRGVLRAFISIRKLERE